MKPQDLTLAQMESFIGTEGIAVLDFWAPWCGPCRSFAPIFERVASKNPDARWGKVNTEVERELAQMFQIRSIPTLMLFRDGVMLLNQPGMVPEASLDEVLRQARALDMDEVRREMAAG
jgi:thioredoxin 1